MSVAIRHINNDLRHKNCPFCKALEIYKVGNIDYGSTVYFSTNLIKQSLIPELWKCTVCGSGFVQNIIPREIAEGLYQEGYSGDRWSRMPVEESKTKEAVDALKAIFKSGSKVLDIGCNTGELLDFAKSRGCRTFGIETSEQSRSVIKEKGHVAFMSFSEVKETFDVITAFDLVEHLYDVKAFFDFCRDRLLENGLLVALTGDINSFSARITRSNWWYIRYPEHILFPSKKYFEIYSGFHVENWIHTYASAGYKHPFWVVFRGFAGGMISGNYTGLPTLGPDHVLAVLRK